MGDAGRRVGTRLKRLGGAPIVAASLSLLLIPAAAAAMSETPSTAKVVVVEARKPEPIPLKLLIGTGAKKGFRTPADEVIGVASFNVFAPGALAGRIADVHALTADPRVDILGLQETRDNQGRTLMRAAVPADWSYVQDWQQDNSAEVAVAWRSSRFELVSANTFKACLSVAEIATKRKERGYSNKDNRSAPARYSAVIVLRDLLTGRTVEIINAHTNQRTEVFHGNKAGQPLNNANAQGALTHFAQLQRLIAASTADYTFVTGDLNVGFVADQRVRHPRFPNMMLGRLAVSSYSSLGLRGLKPSLTTSSRYADYVMVTRRSRAVFLKQWLLDGYHSDHRPLIAQFALR